jgi:glycosyltransferase involved in cell wall biosynthesis
MIASRVGDRAASCGVAPKRVLILLSEVFADGGIQRFNRTFLAACARLPLHCDVFSFADTDASARAAPVVPNTTVRAFGRSKLRFTQATARALLGGGYEYVVIGHVHMLEMAVAAAALRAFRGPRLMLVAHGVEIWTGVRRLRRQALAAVHRILCVSEFTKMMIQKQAPELPAERFTIFPNALSDTWVARQHAADITPLEAPPTQPLPERFILSVARLSRQDRAKGIVSVIEALASLEDRELHYVVAGTGDDMDFLRQTVARHGVADRVHFLGAVTDQQLVTCYRSCTAFVLPSGQEGFGIVFLEAMYFGAPVIAAREKGAVDVVEDGRTGLLVAFGDVVGLKGAIERVLGDAGLLRRLVEQARSTVTGSGVFTFEAFVARCGNLLEALPGG